MTAEAITANAIKDIRDLNIVFCDSRFGGGNRMPMSQVHAMAKEEAKPKPKTKRRTMAECLAIANGELFQQTRVIRGEEVVLKTRIVAHFGQYIIQTPRLEGIHGCSKSNSALYDELLRIQAEIIKGMSDDEIAALSAQYKQDLI